MFAENISPDLVVKVSVSCVKIISIACAKEDEQDVIVEKVELLLGIVIWSEETVVYEKICVGLQIFFVAVAKVVAFYLTLVKLLWNSNNSLESPYLT